MTWIKENIKWLAPTVAFFILLGGFVIDGVLFGDRLAESVSRSPALAEDMASVQEDMAMMKEDVAEVKEEIGVWTTHEMKEDSAISVQKIEHLDDDLEMLKASDRAQQLKLDQMGLAQNAIICWIKEIDPIDCTSPRARELAREGTSGNR